MAFQRGDLEHARELANRLLAVQGDIPQLHHLLGLIDCRLSEFESGIEWLRRASEAEPENVRYRVMLVRALNDSGRPRDALDAAQPPNGTTPAELALWHARAEAATSSEAWLEAVRAWKKLCFVGIGDWRAWNNLADSYGRMSRWSEAVEALRQALKLNPTELALRRKLARALNNAAKYEESVEEFRRCIEAEPLNKFLRISLAAILADLGREEESEAELNKAAQLAGAVEIREDGVGLVALILDEDGSIDIGSLTDLAQFLERSSRMDALARLLADSQSLGVRFEQLGLVAASSALREGNPGEAKRLLLNESSAIQPLRWRWLNSRIEDALGNPQAAFDAAEAMNRSVETYAHWRSIAAEEIKSLRRIGAAITPSWAAKLPRLDAGPRPMQAFIVGFPRSGTTLLETFLIGHPSTAVLDEIPLTRELERVIGGITRLPDCSEAELERARRMYFAERGRHLDSGFAGVVIDKLPLNMIAAPLLDCVFPGSPIIFAQRHPCDAVLSCFMQSFALTPAMACFLDIRDAADFYDAVMTIWTQSCETLMLNVHTIIYEHLVSDPEASLRPAIEFLGLEWREKLLDHRATAKSRGRISTPSYNQVTQPLTSSAVGRWKRYQKQLAPVLPLLLRWAERLGYED